MQTTRQILQSHLTLIEWCEVVVNVEHGSYLDDIPFVYSPHLILATLFLWQYSPQGFDYWYSISERIKQQA